MKNSVVHLSSMEKKLTGKEKPFLREPYTWKTYGDMNIDFWNEHQKTSYDDAKKLLQNSHKKNNKTDRNFFERRIVFFSANKFQFILDFILKVQYIVLLGGTEMNAVSYSNLRQKLKTYLDRVYNDSAPLIITRKNDENLVLISIHEYNSLMETNYLLSNDANAKHLKKSISQYESGKVRKKTLFIDE